MDKEGKPQTRKHGPHLRVPVLLHEQAAIRRQADAAGLPVAAYLRNIGLGHEVTSVLDYRRVDDLARINGDLGRLGGLLKLWLTNDERLRQVSADEIRAVLIKIERNQDAMRAIMQTVLSR
ncbi:MAG: conjugal transfer transcriptional regulator TraJ [Nitrosospira sp.]